VHAEKDPDGFFGEGAEIGMYLPGCLILTAAVRQGFTLRPDDPGIKYVVSKGKT
jgi:hypothetical protein